MTRPRSRRPGSVLVAVNPFKGSLSARQVAEACGRGVQTAGWSADLMPGADGGDGLLEALRAAGVVGRTTTHRVAGPLGPPVETDVDWLDGGTAVIESRYVVGLGLVPVQARDPAATSTRGLGELIVAVGAAGAKRILVGLGGSATMDGGLGMASVWGWRPRTEAGDDLEPLGASLERVGGVDAGARPPVDLVALYDVGHHLLGEGGAQRFAVQKGASREDARRLGAGLERLVGRLGDAAADVAREAGTGAAGGLGFGLRFFGGASLLPGANWVLDRIGFPKRMGRSDLVLTAEGAFDDTSLGGKLTGTVIRRAQHADKPVGLLAPSARGVPAGVEVESGGGRWTAADLERRAAALVGRLGRLPPP